MKYIKVNNTTFCELSISKYIFRQFLLSLWFCEKYNKGGRSQGFGWHLEISCLTFFLYFEYGLMTNDRVLFYYWTNIIDQILLFIHYTSTNHLITLT